MSSVGMAAVLAVVLACVALMGYAIQRGATCTVAAVDEWVDKRRAHRLLGMFEAALWVAGGLVVAAALTRLPAMPAGYAITGWTIAGGVLLGLGAWVNGACVFGAIARLGSGEWAFAATPLGYFAGAATVQALFAQPPPQPLAMPSVLFAAAPLFAVAFVLFALWRLVPPLLRMDVAMLRARVWQPHAATIVIGITFLVTLLLAGDWAYTDLLADLARGMSERVALRLALFAALLGGAAWGGNTAGRWSPTWPAARQVALCLAGGALMGWGTLLIPGSNDGLILVGMPLLRPYAWLAFGTMCLTIALAQLARRRWPSGMSHFHHGSAPGGGAA